MCPLRLCLFTRLPWNKHSMSAFQRMRRLHPWKPHVKKSPVEDRHLLRLPQYMGIPGWILLSHEADGKPVAGFVDSRDTWTPLKIVMDERMCSDTVLRVVQLKPDVFLVYDLRTLNGVNLFEKLSYAERRARLRELLDAFHSPDLVALVDVDDAPVGELIRGTECYDDQPGTLGVFLPAEE
jgi:hypothetical protein